MAVDDAELSARANARVGTMLRGKYAIERVLGAGGMATVYAATTATEAGRHQGAPPRAIAARRPPRPLPPRGIPGQPRAATPAPWRARRRRRRRRGGVPRHGAARGGDAPRPGQRAGRRLPSREVLAIGYQLLDVLGAAHATGIVHRDVKPDNLSSRQRRRPQGPRLRHRAAGGRRRRARHRDRHASRHARVHAPRAGPRALGEIDARTDLWSVGATMFELLSGEHRPRRRERERAAAGRCHARAPPLVSVAPGTPQALAAIVDRALARTKAIAGARRSPCATPSSSRASSSSAASRRAHGSSESTAAP